MLLFHFSLSLPYSAFSGLAERVGNTVSEHVGKEGWVTYFSSPRKHPDSPWGEKPSPGLKSERSTQV